ncbi:MAG: hypothetical protein J6W96_02990 [Alphaproteobacteria bacterium]|nr:hypothetical protein [Alphaproteobacteria bacterium]
MANDKTKSKANVTYEYSPEDEKMTYRVEKGGKSVCALSINDRGYVFLFSGEEDELIARLKIRTERELKNIGGAEQYQYVRKPVKLNSIDGLLDVYSKILDADFTTYDVVSNKRLDDEEKEKVGRMMTHFIDKYVLSTPESREVLHEYLQEKNDRKMMRLKYSKRER